MAMLVLDATRAGRIGAVFIARLVVLSLRRADHRAASWRVRLRAGRGLADFAHVAVRVAHVPADLGAAVDRRRHGLGPLLAPLLIARLDVRDPQVSKSRT